MIAPEITLIIDILGMLLLAAVIVYAIRLNGHLKILQANKADMEGLLTAFNQSTERAQASIERLKASSAETSSAVSAQMHEARELRDDLAYLADRANDAADRLERAIKQARQELGPADKASMQAAAGTGRQAKSGGTEGEEDPSKSKLLKTIQGMR